MKYLYSGVVHAYSSDDLFDALSKYVAAGWRPVGDPVIGSADYQNNGITTVRTEYFQKVIKRAKTFGRFSGASYSLGSFAGSDHSTDKAWLRMRSRAVSSTTLTAKDKTSIESEEKTI